MAEPSVSASLSPTAHLRVHVLLRSSSLGSCGSCDASQSALCCPQVSLRTIALSTSCGMPHYCTLPLAQSSARQLQPLAQP